MKHPQIIIIAFLFIIQSTFAQSTASLKVGDVAPPLTPLKWLKGAPLSSFAKGQVYVIEFGATWCKPCIAMMPHLSEIADKYKGQVTVISMFVMESNTEPLDTKDPAYVRRVVNFINKRNDQMRYTIAIDDAYQHVKETWLSSSERNGIPWVFVVNKEGRISAINAGNNSLDDAIANAVSGQKLEESLASNSTPKQDNPEITMDTSFMFRSELSKYVEGVSKVVPMYFYAHQDEKKGTPGYYQRGTFETVGPALCNLYMLAYADTLWPHVWPRLQGSTRVFPDTIAIPMYKDAYGNFWHELVLEVKDQYPFAIIPMSAINRYNYTLKIPPEKANAMVLQQAMQRDLKTYFNYDVRIEERMMPCWKLVALNGTDKIVTTRTPGQKFKKVVHDDSSMSYTNATIQDLIVYLAIYYGFGNLDHGALPKSEIAPYVNATNFKGELDFSVQQSYSKDFNLFRGYLNTIGLDLVKGTKRTKVIIVSDPK